MNLSRLLEKINAINASVSIYRKDLRKLIRELEDEFGFNELGEAEARLDEIEAEIEDIQKRERRLYRQAVKLLDDVEDATNRK